MRVLDILRLDKKAIIALTLVPIIAGLAICFIFSKIYIEKIPFGIADMDNSSLSRAIVEQFNNHPGLNISYYTDSQADLEEAIKNKKILGGLIIPENYNKNVIQLKAPKTLLLIDGTNMVIGNSTQGYCSSILSTFNTQFQLNILEGKNMLPYTAKQVMATFTFSERVLYDPTLSYMRNLIYTVIGFVVQMIYMTFFLVPILIEEKLISSKLTISKKEQRARLYVLFKRISVIIVIACSASFMGLCFAGKFFGIPLRGSILEYFALMVVFLIDLTAIGFVISAFFDDLVYFIEVYAIINLMFILTSGIALPEYMMPKYFATIIKSIWPFIYVAIPLKALNLKGIGWHAILPSINGGIVYALFWLPIGLKLYTSKITSIKNTLSSKNTKKAIEENYEL
ncbi:ABC transporter permease [Desulfosporosinus fructosivorans]